MAASQCERMAARMVSMVSPAGCHRRHVAFFTTIRSPLCCVKKGAHETGPSSLKNCLLAATRGDAIAQQRICGEVVHNNGPMSAAAFDSSLSPTITDTQRRAALTQAEIGSWVWDFAAGHFVIDARWCAVTSLDSCAGRDHLLRWARNIHPDDLFDFQRRLEELRTGQSDSFECEYRILTSDSRWLWLLHRGQALEHDETGRPLRACGVCMEIDLRKQAEVARQENEARLATALWGARAAFWQWQIATDAIQMSPLWFAMTGYSREQWEGAPDAWFSRIHPEDTQQVRRQMHAHLLGEVPAIDIEYRIRTGNGRWKWMLTRGRAVAWDFDGNATMAIGISLDIHARKEVELLSMRTQASTLDTERERLQREIVEIANREQRRIGGDLHDGLGQELTGIALLLRGLAAQLEKEGLPHKGHVDEVIGLVNGAIESTRSLARGLSPVSPERGGLVMALQALAARCQERYGIPIEFHDDAGDAAGRLDETAATHLYRIAQESLTNVARHSLATAATMRLGPASGGTGLQLSIEDNGRGLAHRTAEKCAGLGLKIMRYRAQMLRGDLALETPASGGTWVRCVFPTP